jgi:hypothetical protein
MKMLSSGTWRLLYSAVKVNCIVGLCEKAARIEKRKNVKKRTVNFFIKLFIRLKIEKNAY